MPSPKDDELCQAAREVICENASGVPAKALAAAMGWSVIKLYELADPDSTRHIWLENAVSLFLCGGRDDRLLQALCRKVGGVFVDLERYKNADADVELTKALKEAADFFAKAAEYAADGTITAKEKRRLREEAEEAIAAVLGFLNRKGVPV